MAEFGSPLSDEQVGELEVLVSEPIAVEVVNDKAPRLLVTALAPRMAPERSDPSVTVLAYRLGVTHTFGLRPWFWEGSVQNALAAHLVSEGWEIREAADTESKAPGIDLLATKDHRRLAMRNSQDLWIGFPR